MLQLYWFCINTVKWKHVSVIKNTRKTQSNKIVTLIIIEIRSEHERVRAYVTFNLAAAAAYYN